MTRIHEFRVKSAGMFSPKNHYALKFVFDVISCENKNLAIHLLLNHNDQHFRCVIRWFIIMLETDEYDSWCEHTGHNNLFYKFDSENT